MYSMCRIVYLTLLWLFHHQHPQLIKQIRFLNLVDLLVHYWLLLSQPHRLRPLRGALRHILGQRDNLWITRPGEMFDYVASLPEGLIP